MAGLYSFSFLYAIAALVRLRDHQQRRQLGFAIAMPSKHKTARTVGDARPTDAMTTPNASTERMSSS